jgi:hypothetical protein
MYVNFEVLNKSDLEPEDIILLTACRQNRTEDLGKYIEDKFGKPKLWILEQKGFIEYIKGAKKDTEFDKVRMTKKGQEFIDTIETPGVTEDDIKLYEWLEAEYKSSGRVIGNRKKTKMYISLFRAHSRIERNRLAFLCDTFLNDEDQMKYSQKLEYMFFKPSGAYNTRFDIEESRLYKYYLAHQEAFDKEFEKLD